MKRNVLILGASGFVGRNLEEQLNSTYRVIAPSHKELDLTDEAETTVYFKTHHIDVVINAAGAGGSRKEEYEKNALETNLQMFFNIVRNKKYYRKLIHLGSGAEYDKRQSLSRVREQEFGQHIPSDDYGFFKYLCSKYIETADHIVSLRIFGLFGKYEDYRYRFISNAIVRNLLGLPITIQKNVYFDYVYIDDFVKIIDYFIGHGTKQKFYNIGSGTRIDLLTIAEKVNGIGQKRSRILVESPGLSDEYTCSNIRLTSEIKHLRFMDIDESIRTLYSWYKKNLHNLKYAEEI